MVLRIAVEIVVGILINSGSNGNLIRKFISDSIVSVYKCVEE